MFHPIAGFPGYFVNESGDVVQAPPSASTTRGVAVFWRNGYARVRLRGACGLRHWRPVHRVVLETFVGPRPTPRHHGAHLDGNRNNNDRSNLAWKTPEENEADKRAHGTQPKGGARVPMTARARAEIRRRYRKTGASLTGLARDYGVHRSTVAKIVKAA